MLDIPLQEIITAHTDTMAHRYEEFLPMIRLLLRLREGPVSPERLATAMHWTRSEVEAFFQSSSLVVDAERNIHIHGQSAHPGELPLARRDKTR